MSSKPSTDWLKHSLLRLSPNVFFHHIWTDFVRTNTLFAPHLIEELNQAAEQVMAGNDLKNACQLWLICAVLESRLDNHEAALTLIEKTAELAQKYHLPQIDEWANWGASSLCARQGNWQQAAKYLQRLQQTLNEQGEWMLANIIALLESELAQLATREQDSPPNLTAEPQLDIVLEQLLRWEKPVLTSIPASLQLDDGRSSAWGSFWQAVTGFFRGKPRSQPEESPAAVTTDVLPTTRLQERWLPPLAPPDLNRPEQPTPDTPPALAAAAVTDKPSSAEGVERLQDRPFSQRPADQLPFQSTLPAQLKPPDFPDSGKEQGQRQAPIQQEEGDEPILIIYCLGTFRVYHNTNLIVDWNGLKGQLIFKYLITRQGKPIPKDVLMELIWPETDQDSARRNLHQAIYSLRKTLKKDGSDFQPIRYENACYLFNPNVEIWVDYKEFEQHVRIGRQLERNNLIAKAMAEYGIAEGLYQGDFLAEDIYEDWTHPLREQLRQDYIDITDRLSKQYFLQNEYTATIAICQKLLAQDNCHEGAHRRLMRCYQAQNQRHLAIRQYHHCCETLAEELNITPSEETHALFQELTSR